VSRPTPSLLSRKGQDVIIAVALLDCMCLSAAEPTQRRAIPLYTEEDLRRVHPRRGETGVLSVPAVVPGPTHAASPASSRHSRGGTDETAPENYWRRESLRHRQKIARLKRTATSLRRQIDERQHEREREREFGSRRRGAASVASVAPLAGRLADVEAEIQAAEAEFEERSRRAGALPGWLR
jgi:hypothetical protein